MQGALGADEAGYIWALNVHLDHQRQGIGTALLTHAEEHFRSIDLKNLLLDIVETNEAAQKILTLRTAGRKKAADAKNSGHTATVVRHIRAL
jgi:ribosomal protein S18 acetylase RimI-like enzyme